MKVKLSASNIKIISANMRLKPGKYGHWYSNPDYAASMALLYYAFKISLPLDFNYIFEKDIQCNIEVYTYKDIDNILKSVLDVLKKISIITDDREIIILNVIKHKIKRGDLEKIDVILQDDIEK